MIRCKNSFGEYLLEESSGKFYGPNKLILEGNVELQSDLTKNLVEDILENSSCYLTRFSESIPMHKIMIENLLNNWNAQHKTNITILPIT